MWCSIKKKLKNIKPRENIIGRNKRNIILKVSRIMHLKMIYYRNKKNTWKMFSILKIQGSKAIWPLCKRTGKAKRESRLGLNNKWMRYRNKCERRLYWWLQFMASLWPCPSQYGFEGPPTKRWCLGQWEWPWDVLESMESSEAISWLSEITPQEIMMLFLSPVDPQSVMSISSDGLLEDGGPPGEERVDPL